MLDEYESVRHAGEILSRHTEASRSTQPHRDEDGVMLRLQLLHRDVRADTHAAPDLDAEVEDHLRLRQGDREAHLVLGDPEAVQAAGQPALFVDRDRVSRPPEVARTR